MPSSPNGLIFEKSIAVIDDDYAIRDSIRMVLESHRWQAQLYATAEELFAVAKISAPSCIIIDPHLPGLRGPDVVRAIYGKFRDISIIALTAVPTGPIVSEILAAGASVVLTKPVTERVLVDHVAASIGDRL